jgi:hypothetical protein
MYIFLDSGAFSADSQGTPINIEEYISFIKENESCIELHANLDVIGDAEASWKNQEYMESLGVGGLPVFHLEDDIKYLHRCLEYNYFALGGMAGGASEKRRMYFLDMCWDIICDGSGKPKSQIHGFGLASPSLLYRYPWYSFDSSSWVSYGRFGMVLIPYIKNNKYIYDVPPIKIFVTDRSPKVAEEGMHFKTLSKLEQTRFINYIESKGVVFGKTKYKEVSENYVLTENEKYFNKSKTVVHTVLEEGVMNSNFYRDYINYCWYVDLARNIGPYESRRFIRNQIPSLF